MFDGGIENLRWIVNAGNVPAKGICQPVKVALQPVMS
jgi:hypothetical protein